LENSSGIGAVANGAAGESAAVPQISNDNQPSTRDGANRPTSSPNPQDEDPEWDFGEGKKFKRTDAINRVKNLEKGMYKAHEKAAAISKKFEALTQSLSKYGITAEQFLQDPDAHMSRAAQELIARQVDESLMDPKDLELSNREKAIAAREAKIKEQDEAREAKESEARIEARADQVAGEMAPALKAAGLPNNPKTVARMAEVAAQALKQGVKIDMNEAASYVAKLIRQEQEWHLNQYQDAESLVSALGPQRLESIRQHLIAKSRKNQTQTQRPATQPSPTMPKGNIGWGAYMEAKNKRI
jgi:hypothetical protein